MHQLYRVYNILAAPSQCLRRKWNGNTNRRRRDNRGAEGEDEAPKAWEWGIAPLKLPHPGSRGSGIVSKRQTFRNTKFYIALTAETISKCRNPALIVYIMHT